MVTVSIIMPVYNVEDQLERAISSAINQTFQDNEIILVNDGSTDKSGEICNQYKQKSSKIKVIHKKNEGSGLARNEGLKIAKGKYVYFADPDDYLSHHLIEENLKIIEKEKSEMIVFGFYEERIIKNNKKIIEEKYPLAQRVKNKKDFREQFQQIYDFHPYALWNKMYRKTFLEKNDIYFTNQNVGQDALFNIMVLKYVQSISVNKSAYYHYVFRHGSSVNRYREDRFESEWNIASQLELALRELGMDKKFKNIIYKEYWNAVYLELVNLNSCNCPMSAKEKKLRVESILKKEKIKDALKERNRNNEKNPFVLTLVTLLNRNKILSALRVMELRVKMGNKRIEWVNLLKNKMNH